MESQPIAVTVPPSDDFLSRGSMATPTASGGGDDDGGGGPCRPLLQGQSDEMTDKGRDETALDQDSNLTAATLSNSSGSAAAISAGNDMNPHCPTESSSDAAEWLLRSPRAAAAATAAGEAAAALVSGPGSGTETETEAKSEKNAAVALAAGRDDGDLLEGEGGEGTDGGGEGGEGGVPGGVVGGGRSGCDGSGLKGEAGKGGGDADDRDDVIRRPVPPSFSSTNLVRRK